MNRTELTTTDGTGLFFRHWLPKGEVKAVICQCHGQGEHCSRYEHVAAFFNSQGYAFIGYDHRGHGRSKGQRGHFPSYESLMEELDMAMAKADELFPDAPKILYGHSWGGNIVTNYLIRRQPEVRGAILTGPWFKLPPEQAPSPFLSLLAKVMNSIYPAFNNENQIDLKELSSDLAVGEAYEADPLVHGKISAGAYIKSAQAATFALENANKINVPMLVLHGEMDKIISPEGSKTLVNNIGDSAELKIYPGMRHEIHNEKDKAIVLADMLSFIQIILQ